MSSLADTFGSIQPVYCAAFKNGFPCWNRALAEQIRSPIPLIFLTSAKKRYNHHWKIIITVSILIHPLKAKMIDWIMLPQSWYANSVPSLQHHTKSVCHNQQRTKYRFRIYIFIQKNFSNEGFSIAVLEEYLLCIIITCISIFFKTYIV